MKQMIKYLCYLALPFALGGCSDSASQESTEEWMQKAAIGLHGKVDALPELLPYKPYDIQYAAAGSPFLQQRLEDARRMAQGNRPNTNRPRELLENYELSQLKLAGTLLLNKKYFGLIQTPEGAIYRVQTGNYIGPNFGVVRKITETEILLEETVEDINGEWVPQEITLNLLPQEQGQKP